MAKCLAVQLDAVAQGLLSTQLPQEIAVHQVQLVRLDGGRRLIDEWNLQAAAFEVSAQGLHHRCSQGLLHVEQFFRTALEVLGPDQVTVVHAAQQGIDPPLLALLANRTLENRVDIQQPADRGNIVRAILETVGRTPGHDLQPLDLAQGHGQLVGEPVAEKAAAAGLRQVVEGQHRDGCRAGRAFFFLGQKVEPIGKAGEGRGGTGIDFGGLPRRVNQPGDHCDQCGQYQWPAAEHASRFQWL